MENLSYSSYPDSRDSSPRSREIDDNSSWEEPASNNYKVKFMCSYGGKIQPRPHDNQLAYVGGDTKILSVDRNIKFSAIMAKLSSICNDNDVCFKYQLPGEDLDALISVTNDEDLEHMMMEYDRLHRASAKPARLRLFIFPLNLPPSVAKGGFGGGGEVKPERQWFVDALNSVQVQPLEGSSPQAVVAGTGPAGTSDFLFGLEKGFPAVAPTKFQDAPPPVPVVQDAVVKDVYAGSDCGSEDRPVIGEPVLPSVEIQRQIQELQRMQIAAGQQEQAILQRKIDEGNPRIYNAGDYFTTQKLPEQVLPTPAPVPMPIPAAYYQERHMTTGGYPVAAAPAATGTEQQVYLIQTATGVYQAPALRPVTGQVGQHYYGVQRVGQDVYREQPMYSAVPPPTASFQQQPKVGAYTEGIGMVQPKTAVTEPGYVQVGYDGAGRQVYYTAPPPYQAVATADGRQGGGAVNQEGKVVQNAKPTQTSSV
ncbi:putative Xin actin-binding repeat-containing protein 1 [Tripterygium wilfordii]|uniref:Putative Xin actin-binding repeat-containing protein 1 n=1 Tax=Tripterygium wilfordii TaxID=458696 RepID=A0A7J7D186_TRIWF|nr:uncharacterized protein LOC120009585 [Tripterygium wilfordii]KAF5740122.1 putative Xin actin-binding repeat-containing protein 1 [Tripterygium wilfordii]